MTKKLPSDELTLLRAVHRSTRDQREADRIKAVVLLATGWRSKDAAEALLVDPNTDCTHFKSYRADGWTSCSGSITAAEMGC